MITFELTPREGGDPVEVEADASDVYFWERTHRGKTINGLLENKAMVDLYEVAHVAAQRLGVWTDRNVDEFARSFVLATKDEDEDEDQEPDPTLPAP